MSRWLAERLRIGLAPERVDVARLGRWRARATAQTVAAACSPALGQSPWQAALDALPGLLDEIGARRGAVAVVLSNHFVRYLALPWQDELSNDAEVQAWARLRFEHTYGAAASEWLVQTCEAGYGQPLVACAVDRELVEQLGQLLDRQGLRLASLQPLLMAAFNDHRRHLHGRRSFAIVERGRLCLSQLDAGQWRAISSRRIGNEVAPVIAQEEATWDVDAQARQLDVLLVGDAAPWPDQRAPDPHLLGAHELQGRTTLALCGTG